ncbi:DNMT3B, partial [Symbiodinium necroappetens]
TGYLLIPQHRAEVEQIFRLGVVPAMSFAGGALDVSFALGALRIFGHFYGLPGDQVYDYMFEDYRHVLLNLDSSLSARGRLALRPVLDLLTALHVGDTEPVGTGVLRGGALGACSYQEWLQMYPQDHVKLLRCLPNLMLLSRSGGPYERAVHFLRDLLQRGNSMAQELWDRLRATGLQSVALILFDHGVRQVDDILPNASALLAAGAQAWQLETLIRGSLEVVPVLPHGRADHPQARPRKRASWAAALEAAQPEKRQASLAALQADVLAATTRSSVDSRVRAWQELCRGGYHSCSLYFGAAVSHQMRTMGTPIGEDVRWTIRDTVRAIKRGLGPAQLKDSFDVELLSLLVPFVKECVAFHLGDPASEVDLALISAWWMLREIEASNARAHHLYLTKDGDFLAHLLVPISKADTVGQLTVRSYSCICRARTERLCPYHAAERHLHRLQLLRDTGVRVDFLFPASDGKPLSKRTIIQAFERVIASAGVPLTRRDESGREIARFHGHTMRVSGTQFLASMGLSVPMIQLQGRWSSRAIDRYVQLAPLLRMPHAIRMARASGGQDGTGTSSASPAAPVQLSGPIVVGSPAPRPAPPPIAPVPAIDLTEDAAGAEAQVTAAEVRTELRRFMKAVLEPKEMLVVQPRRKVCSRHRGAREHERRWALAHLLRLGLWLVIILSHPSGRARGAVAAVQAVFCRTGRRAQLVVFIVFFFVGIRL